MASVVQHRARSRKRAEDLVSTKSSAEVLCEHAKAEGEFDFILADELMSALGKAADSELRYALTRAGRVALEGVAVRWPASNRRSARVPAGIRRICTLLSA